MKLLRVPPAIYTVRLQGVPVTYTVRRSARAKHMRITISAHSGVVVTLPSRLHRYVNPDDFLREKQEWVLRHLERVHQEAPRAELREGAGINFRGHEHTLRIIQREVPSPIVRVAGRDLLVILPSSFEGDLKEVIKEWMRGEAAELIRVEAERHAASIGVKYNRVIIRDQKTKWGSCSRKGNLSFNWRLVLFPDEILRYVIIHELCHLRHFNHSERFWDMVADHDPRFRESVVWLKKYGVRVEGVLR
jgi:predicted metal-dependent hydrolase